jgi:DNA-3-methyladenine glycosylase II
MHRRFRFFHALQAKDIKRMKSGDASPHSKGSKSVTTKEDRFADATYHLRKRDRVLRKVIDRVGPCRLRPRRDRFATLVHSIVAQQVSGKAAKAIFGRLQDRVNHQVTPDALAQLDLQELRSLGLSRQKAGYLLDLAEKTRNGLVRFTRFGRMTDEAIIDELTQVKGIGRWTAQMLLIFSLGRQDVLPVDDFGIRSAVRNLYGLADLPKKQETHEIAEPWRPYASVASWYLWRSLDNIPT